MSVEVRTQQIVANDLSFTADVAGSPDGELVLLLHGFPQTRHTWRHELVALAEAGYHACAYDQRGYSAGARPHGIESYVLENMVADVFAVAEALDHPQFHLVGHDWGGGVAWTTALTRPERVKTLSVISRPHPKAFAKSLHADPEQANRSRHHKGHKRAEVTDEILANDAQRLRLGLEQGGVPPEDVEAYLNVLSDREALDAALNWYRALDMSQIPKACFTTVDMPTLYVWGNADGAVGRYAAELTQAYVNAPYRFVELPEVGHFVTDQAPEIFPPLLLEHLRGR